MKLFLLLALTLFSSMAMADLAQLHQGSCETDEVKSLVGEKGACRLLIKSKPLQHKGYCMGFLKQTLPCVVFLIAEEDQAEIGLRCGVDIQNPVLGDDSLAEALQYNVLRVIDTQDGRQLLKQDPQTHKVFLSNNMSVFLDEKNPAVYINTVMGVLELSQVRCQ